MILSQACSVLQQGVIVWVVVGVIVVVVGVIGGGIVVVVVVAVGGVIVVVVVVVGVIVVVVVGAIVGGFWGEVSAVVAVGGGVLLVWEHDMVKVYSECATPDGEPLQVAGLQVVGQGQVDLSLK